jgi:hypothetical protein
LITFAQKRNVWLFHTSLSFKLLSANKCYCSELFSRLYFYLSAIFQRCQWLKTQRIHYEEIKVSMCHWGNYSDKRNPELPCKYCYNVTLPNTNLHVRNLLIMTTKLFLNIFPLLLYKSLNFTDFFFLYFQWLLLVAYQVVRISVPRFVVGSWIPKILERHISENISNFISQTTPPPQISILTIPRKRVANLWWSLN